MNKPSNNEIRIGWASADLTPDQPVLVTGQFHARVSEGVMDPVTATVLALESARRGGPRDCAVMVSCDLVAIPDGLRDAVRAQLIKNLPELDPKCVFLNATHTHTGPEIRVESDTLQTGGGNVPDRMGVELEVMAPADYVTFTSMRIAEAVAKAWKSRAPGMIGFGLGQAVVGHNRRITYYDGTTKMYGKTDDPEFSHVEGYEDHSVNLLCTYDKDKKPTGMIVNVACPSQVSENAFQISADFWHDTRVELRRRLGANLFILAQNSAGGDQSPHILVGKGTEERMWRLMGRTQRQDIAARIADTVTATLPFIEKELDANPRLVHRVETVELSRRLLTEQDVKESLVEAEKLRAQYEELRRELEAHPELRQKPRWYTGITAAYRRMNWYKAVVERFERQKTQPKLPIEVHVLRLGDVAIATNPFEYYLDFGLQIKARSKAVQTFLVQHVGSGTYLPTARAVSGKSYGAVPASTPVGPEGGRELVERTLAIIAELWK
ncbi:MAG: hypothetical protein KJ964_11700 [Verrucomicrobia bacterium]|nr:hypothetical protein [Verrucomicrobiota bacterium]MBU1735622.1 hypothetical protein [Verrucomicrobiota bacterium]MBU1855886.1 hypothetical protein [Verrucomicrobiota bacterium]